MKRTVSIMFTVALVATAVASVQDSTPDAAPLKAAQGDPKTMGALERTRTELYAAVQMCLHWGGEEPYDDDRAAQIEAGWARDCGEAVRLGEDALTRFPNDGYVAACAVVLVGYHLGPPSIADRLIGDDATWKRRCNAARRAMDELKRSAPELYSDFEAYSGEGCDAEVARPA